MKGVSLESWGRPDKGRTTNWYRGWGGGNVEKTSVLPETEGIKGQKDWNAKQENHGKIFHCVPKHKKSPIEKFTSGSKLTGPRGRKKLGD